MSRLIVMAGLACAVWFCPAALAQPECKEAVALDDIDFISNAELESCALMGDADAEALLGMMYWGATADAVCDEADCKGGAPEKYGLDSLLTVSFMRAEGLRLLESAASKNHAVAQNELGNALLNSEYGRPHDPIAARGWFEKSTTGGDFIAPYNLARIYIGAYGVERSLSAGEYYLRLSAARGYAPAQCSLMVMLGRRNDATTWLERLLRWTASIVQPDRRCSEDEIMGELF